jgi:hypothetical protein
VQPTPLPPKYWPLNRAHPAGRRSRDMVFIASGLPFSCQQRKDVMRTKRVAGSRHLTSGVIRT